MHYFGILWLTLAAVVVARWLLARTDSIGRPKPFPWFATVALLILGGAALTPFVLRMMLEAKLEKAAAVIVGAPVKVECQSFGRAFVDVGVELGFVPYGPDGVPLKETLIKRDQCRDLASYLRSDKESPEPKHVVAVHIVTHEAMHMKGETSEERTECYAVQRDAEMARLLGASPAAARDLAVTYWKEHYPRLPANYRSADCLPGGALDLGGDEAPWDLDASSYD